MRTCPDCGHEVANIERHRRRCGEAAFHGSVCPMCGDSFEAMLDHVLHECEAAGRPRHKTQN